MQALSWAIIEHRLNCSETPNGRKYGTRGALRG